MNRTWSFLMGIAVLMMLAVFAYEIVVSVSGGNVTFTKTVVSITPDLGTTNIATFEQYFPNVMIKTEQLDDK